ncbi:MAG: HAD-IA family hydrolase [Ignavibacteriae bacterium]|nr:HAD-IA family hydrolase [Ignavibacteriota bacterium]
MKRFSCIIFDLDGTLAQTNELIFSTFNHVAKKYAGKVFTPSEITAMFGPPEEVAIEKLVGAERADEAMDEFYTFYEAHHPRLADAYQGIREILDFLKQRGILLAVFTGKGSRTALITLEKIGLKDYFDIIITGHDVSSHKPSSEGIQKVMKRFRLRPHEVLMVGDSVADVKAAHEAGVPIAAVLWDSYSKDKVLQMDVDFRFHSVMEFSDWIRTAISTIESNPIE